MSLSYLLWIKCLSVLIVFTWQALASLYHLMRSLLAEPGPDTQPGPLRLFPFRVFQGTRKNDLMQMLVQTQERGCWWEPLNSCEKELLFCLIKNWKMIVFSVYLILLVPVVDVRQPRHQADMVWKMTTCLWLCQKETGSDHSLLPWMNESMNEWMNVWAEASSVDPAETIICEAGASWMLQQLENLWQGSARSMEFPCKTMVMVLKYESRVLD